MIVWSWGWEPGHVCETRELWSIGQVIDVPPECTDVPSKGNEGAGDGEGVGDGDGDGEGDVDGEGDGLGDSAAVAAGDAR